jgi:transposase
MSAGRRQVIIETGVLPGCPSCGVIASRRKERRLQRLRDIPVAGPVKVLWSKYRWYCEESAWGRLSFFEWTPQVPRRARSTSRLRAHLVDAVVRSGRAVSETAAGFAVSWWMVRAALNEACLLGLPDMDKLSPRMLGIDEHRFRSVRYFQCRDHKGVGDWLFARPLEWRLAVQVVAIDPSAAFRKALRMWLPRTAVAVDHFHLISLANQAMTETRQNLPQQVKGRRGRAIDKAWPTACSCCAAATTSAAGHPSGCKRCSPRTTPPAPLMKSPPHPTGTPPADPSNRALHGSW